MKRPNYIFSFVNKIIISFMMFFVAIVTLGTTTFAWYTLARNVNVDDIILNISSGSELEMSLDMNSYQSSFSKEEMEAHVKKISNGELELIPVTSKDGYLLKQYKKKKEKDAISNKHYLELAIEFRADNIVNYDNKKLGVFISDYKEKEFDSEEDNSNTYVISKGVLFNNTLADFRDSNGTIVKKNQKGYLKKITESLRVSFCYDYSNNSTKIFDFSDHPEYGYGYGYNPVKVSAIGTEFDSEQIYYELIDEEYIIKNDVTIENYDSSKLYIDSLVGAASYCASCTTYKFDPPQEFNTRIYTKDDVLKNSDIGPKGVTSNANGLVAIMEYKQGTDDYRGGTTVRIWIEGYDADCYDIALDDVIKVQLAFNLAFYD